MPIIKVQSGAHTFCPPLQANLPCYLTDGVTGRQTIVPELPYTSAEQPAVMYSKVPVNGLRADRCHISDRMHLVVSQSCDAGDAKNIENSPLINCLRALGQSQVSSSFFSSAGEQHAQYHHNYTKT